MANRHVRIKGLQDENVKKIIKKDSCNQEERKEKKKIGKMNEKLNKQRKGETVNHIYVYMDNLDG